ncbi:hypothetical protein B484DRAFT_454941 [Ochromonadaceae sp. CCMP2298]|nr:hypothetical protein B484DRAFT_454941 [Ochromonadaceae sp. CCMP2298]|eukprot:CAMPEP_0173188876 /NCGR_PEP_ID=MMETSP1141-20130122/11485_1 /TAXON_ID=483371 /ORGANISM="non described non described, Strain CCMP2298" /LENGTH=386 /DNA_ID=CAMNT_0014112827 /DNA_START=14 /DNA_END=1174 /DNA_ORIENTATION=-
MSSGATETHQGRARLVLHFDVNKTILMSDDASGRTIDQTLNSLLTECTWGIADLSKPRSQRRLEDWVVCHATPATHPPQQGALSLGEYLEDHTEISKATQRSVKRAFTDAGCVGERFRPHLRELDAQMRLGDTEAAKARAQGLSYLAEGLWHIVPSFFRLVEHLAEQDVPFCLLLRTFGTDISNVCDEFNLFCSGLHPAYSPSRKLDGTDPRSKDLRIHLPQCSGRMLRTGDSAADIHMAHLQTDTLQIASGAHKVYAVMMEWFREGEGGTLSAAVQDHFQWWADQGESDTSGKLLLVETQTPQPDVAAATATTDVGSRNVHVFFDDNIERNRAHIVDVRDERTFLPVPFAQARGRHLRRVDPYSAIMDREYFIREVQDVMALHGL